MTILLVWAIAGDWSLRWKRQPPKGKLDKREFPDAAAYRGGVSSGRPGSNLIGGLQESGPSRRNMDLLRQ